MFTRQKERLADANRLHMAAASRKKLARQEVIQRRQQFLGKPINLLFPYIAGILICASQLKNDATGLKRVPFLNIAKAGVGLWTLVSRIRKINDGRSTTAEGAEQ